MPLSKLCGIVSISALQPEQLLDNVESRKNILTGNNYNTIKGEALGLRAFLHFDLLRMFAPSPALGGLNVPAIPYVSKISPYAVPFSTTGGVLDSCIADLTRAQSLLSDTATTTSRFTYWAARGLLARVFLYKGDLPNAQANALAVISSNKFPLSVNNSDLMFTKENLFSLFSSLNISAQYYKSVLNTNPPLVFYSKSNSIVCNRWWYNQRLAEAFVDPVTAVALGNTISPRKYYATNANVLPMIRVSEMYYIAAECATANLDSLKATDLLDSIRVHRNVPKYTVAGLRPDSLNIEIREEYQKEVLGEGQMFYFYKRKNLPFSALPFTKVPVVTNASYVFIKPE
jgi:hypothetical protein